MSDFSHLDPVAGTARKQAGYPPWIDNLLRRGAVHVEEALGGRPPEKKHTAGGEKSPDARHKLSLVQVLRS